MSAPVAFAVPRPTPRPQPPPPGASNDGSEVLSYLAQLELREIALMDQLRAAEADLQRAEELQKGDFNTCAMMEEQLRKLTKEAEDAEWIAKAELHAKHEDRARCAELKKEQQHVLQALRNAQREQDETTKAMDLFADTKADRVRQHDSVAARNRALRQKLAELGDIHAALTTEEAEERAKRHKMKEAVRRHMSMMMQEAEMPSPSLAAAAQKAHICVSIGTNTEDVDNREELKAQIATYPPRFSHMKEQLAKLEAEERAALKEVDRLKADLHKLSTVAKQRMDHEEEQLRIQLHALVREDAALEEEVKKARGRVHKKEAQDREMGIVRYP